MAIELIVSSIKTHADAKDFYTLIRAVNGASEYAQNDSDQKCGRNSSHARANCIFNQMDVALRKS